MVKLTRIFFLALILVSSLMLVVGSAVSQSREIVVLHVEGAIVPVTAAYLDRGIARAESRNAAAVIIVVNTPGGLLSSTEVIVDRILNAKVPVVAFVDKWAGSAGTFVTLASHVAAMSPGSRIGAASPVSVDPSGAGIIDETLAKKIKEDTAARIRSLAQLHGRNEAAAIATVIEALSFTDREALGIAPLTQDHQTVLGLNTRFLSPPLVDLGAENLAQLIARIDGMPVTVAGRQTVISTAGYTIDDAGMTFAEKFLHVISDPTIAYILLSIGMLGITVEIFNFGAIIPGVIGAISLVTGFYALSVLEASWAGVFLVLLAFGLFVAEAFTPTFGVLTAGGIAAMVMGAFILFGRGTAVNDLSVNWWVVGAVIAVIVAVFTFVIAAVVRAHRRRPAIGEEAFVGHTGTAKSRLDPEGMVSLYGERWTAVSEDGRIEAGEDVVVTRIDGLKIWVKRKEKGV